MVVEESGLILETNGRALDLFRPLESDPPLTFLYPLVNPSELDRVRLCFFLAKEQGSYELDEIEFSGGSNGVFTGDIHVARIVHAEDESPVSFAPSLTRDLYWPNAMRCSVAHKLYRSATTSWFKAKHA